jgi:hypothetical protein
MCIVGDRNGEISICVLSTSHAKNPISVTMCIGSKGAIHVRNSPSPSSENVSFIDFPKFPKLQKKNTVILYGEM